MIQSQPESLASSGNRTMIPQTTNSYSTHYSGLSILEVKNYTAFYEIQSLLPCSQEPANSPYRKPD